jgi:hypothetical protein
MIFDKPLRLRIMVCGSAALALIWIYYIWNGMEREEMERSDSVAESLISRPDSSPPPGPGVGKLRIASEHDSGNGARSPLDNGLGLASIDAPDAVDEARSSDTRELRVELLLRSQEHMANLREDLPREMIVSSKLSFLSRCVGAILLDSGRGEILDGTVRRSLVSDDPNEYVILVDDHVFRFNRGEFALYDQVYAAREDEHIELPYDYQIQAQLVFTQALAALGVPEMKDATK